MEKRAGRQVRCVLLERGGGLGKRWYGSGLTFHEIIQMKLVYTSTATKTWFSALQSSMFSAVCSCCTEVLGCGSYYYNCYSIGLISSAYRFYYWFAFCWIVCLDCVFVSRITQNIIRRSNTRTLDAFSLLVFCTLMSHFSKFTGVFALMAVVAVV